MTVIGNCRACSRACRASVHSGEARVYSLVMEQFDCFVLQAQVNFHLLAQFPTLCIPGRHKHWDISVICSRHGGIDSKICGWSKSYAGDVGTTLASVTAFDELMEMVLRGLEDEEVSTRCGLIRKDRNEQVEGDNYHRL